MLKNPYKTKKVNNIYAGEGILTQIKEPSYPSEVITVEWLYETTGKEWWPLLDMMLADREDLQERIKKIHDNKRKNRRKRRY